MQDPAIERWCKEGVLSAEASENVILWMTDPAYADFVDEIGRLIADEDLEELEDAFRTRIEFGTGGIRGRMGAGPNRINLRTMGEAAQGLAEYVLEASGTEDRKRDVAIAHDTRNNSRRFAEDAAAIMAGNGVVAHLFDGPRATPALSFALRELGCVAGIVVSASHNPPADNGFKAYWNDGGQVVPPHDKAIIARVQAATDINRADEVEARAGGLIRTVADDIDEAYIQKTSLDLCPERDVTVVFTPLHGVGATSVVPALENLGFKDIQVVSAQNDFNGNFPTLAGGVANPEVPDAMSMAIDAARSAQADLVLASDPDADRLGVCVPDPVHGWNAPPSDLALNGNQIGVIALHFLLERRKATNTLPARGVFAETIVTTDLSGLVARAFGVRVVDDLLVGFKYIAEVINALEHGESFLFGTEESHGYLATDVVRDKDAGSVAMILAQCAAHLKSQGSSMREYLDEIYREHGYFREIQKSITREGAGGSRDIQRIMRSLRENPPSLIGQDAVVEVRDRQEGVVRNLQTGDIQEIPGPRGNVLAFTFTDEGHTRVTARPSGTEPKIKYYVSAASSDLEDCRKEDLERTRDAVDRRAQEILDGMVEVAEAALKGQG